MSCATIVPARRLTICDFLSNYDLKLTVHEDGERDWYAALSPTVQVYDEGDWNSEPSWKTAVGFSGQSSEAAIRSLCRTLSGSSVRVLLSKKTSFFFRHTFDVLPIDHRLTTVVPE